MKLLVAARYFYYGDSNGIEPQFYYLAKVPEVMGHEVDYFTAPSKTTFAAKSNAATTAK